MSDVQSRQSQQSNRSDSVILSLREELQVLYKSLQIKNEELIVFEKTILERETQINNLQKICRRLADGLDGSDKHLFLASIEADKLAKQNEIASERSDSTATSDQNDPVDSSQHVELLAKLREQEETITELNEKVLRLTRHLNYVQRNSQTKDERITELQNEIDKFRQIVRPITQAMLKRQSQKQCDCMSEWSDCISGIGDWSPGVEHTRVLSVKEPRMKRQAISAEPLSQMARLSQDTLIKIPKSSL